MGPEYWSCLEIRTHAKPQPLAHSDPGHTLSPDPGHMLTQTLAPG